MEISYLGYQMFTVPVGKQTYINVALVPNVNELDEVTIVAFGKQKKESVISAIQTVNIKDLKVPSSNPPYVKNSERHAISPNVLDHEPHGALFVPDDNPLLFYEAIAVFARLPPDVTPSPTAPNNVFRPMQNIVPGTGLSE